MNAHQHKGQRRDPDQADKDPHEPRYDDQDPRDYPRKHPPLHEPDEVPFRRHDDG